MVQSVIFFCLYQMGTEVGCRANEAAVGAKMGEPSSGSLACHCTGLARDTLSQEAPAWGLLKPQEPRSAFPYVSSCSQSLFVMKLNTPSTPRRNCHKNPAIKTKRRVKIQ